MTPIDTAGTSDSGWPAWLPATDHVLAFYPSYTDRTPRRFHMAIAPAIQEIAPAERRLDHAAVACLVRRTRMMGDRTLLQGVSRAPWMARPAVDGGWLWASIPAQGHARPPAKLVAEHLKSALKDELGQLLAGASAAGILLSGGLDSRIVAGIVRELQLEGGFRGEAVALTWGEEDWRDVKYAREIARRYGWEWRFFPLGPELLEECIYVAGGLGAEASPIHLHALPRVSEIEGLDPILNAMLGNSTGRGRYPGRQVARLGPMMPSTIDPHALLSRRRVEAVRGTIEMDCYGYRSRVYKESETQYRELEQLMHLIRRFHQATLGLVAEKTRVFDPFSARGPVELMWSLDPRARDGRYYAEILPTLPGGVGGIPDARTGLPLGSTGGTPDPGRVQYTTYGGWLRGELRSTVEGMISGGALQELHVFNERALERLMALWPSAHTRSANRLDALVAWLASLAVFVQRYKVLPPEGRFETDFIDEIRAAIGRARLWANLRARDRLRE